jgi:hypothetical protein
MILCNWKGTQTYWIVWWWSHQWRILHDIWWVSRWDCAYVQGLHVDYFNITIDRGYGTTFWTSYTKFIFLTTICIRTYGSIKTFIPFFWRGLSKKNCIFTQHNHNYFWYNFHYMWRPIKLLLDSYSVSSFPNETIILYQNIWNKHV